MERIPTEHELREWIEIEVSRNVGHGSWVIGVYQPYPESEYEYVLLGWCPTQGDAIREGESIAVRASAERLLMGLAMCECTVRQ
jgi:hypothetical protein